MSCGIACGRVRMRDSRLSEKGREGVTTIAAATTRSERGMLVTMSASAHVPLFSLLRAPSSSSSSLVHECTQMKGCIYREDENGSVTEEFPEIVYPGKHTLPIDVDNDIVELYRYARRAPVPLCVLVVPRHLGRRNESCRRCCCCCAWGRK